MSSGKLHYLPAVILVLGCLGLVKSRRQQAVPLAGPLTTVIPAVDGYRTRDLTVTDDERRVAGMTDLVARAYLRDTVIAFTTLVSYYDRQTQGKSIHSPRNCLPGAGWEILSAGSRELDVDGKRHVVNYNILKNGSATAAVWYWYQGRGRIVANEYTVKWNLLRDAALLGHTEEALVRVVVPIARAADSLGRSQAVASADTLGLTIARQLAREVARVLPKSETITAAR
jgi:EpsI family protein